MNTPTSVEELREQTEQLVRSYLDVARKEAQGAVEQAFVAASGLATKPTKAATKPRKMGRRRSPHEVAELGKRVYAVVCSRPGESMAVLAKDVGASVRDLHRPMALLKRDGQVRSVGERHLTRYFPMVAAAVESA